jgi:hypothetical protein
VLHALTDLIAHDVENDLANDEEKDAKQDVAQRPTVLERTDDKNDLAGDVDEELDGVDNVEYDKNADGILRAQPAPAFESEEGYGAADNEHDE